MIPIRILSLLLCIIACTRAEPVISNPWDIFNVLDVDCYFDPWGDWTLCKVHPDGVFMSRYRKKHPKRGNGRDCDPGEKTCERIDCTILDSMMKSMRSNFMTESAEGTEKSLSLRPGIAARELPDSGLLCSKDVKEKDKTGRMLGKKCTSGAGRRKRSVMEELMRFRRQASSARKHRDVLFLIDESGSIKEENFPKEKDLTRTIISSLCAILNVGNTQTRVAVNTFDRIVHEHFDFDFSFSKPNIDTEIKNIKWNSTTGGRTCIHKALKHANETMFTAPRGARVNNRDNTEGMIVLITDGTWPLELTATKRSDS